MLILKILACVVICSAYELGGVNGVAVFLLPLMNSFNTTEAAIYPMKDYICFLKTFLFQRFIYPDLHYVMS